jgi:hypothetical protein
MVLFGAGPVARGGCRNTGRGSEQLLDVHTPRGVCDYVFGVRLKGGTLFAAAQVRAARSERKQRRGPLRTNRFDRAELVTRPDARRL